MISFWAKNASTTTMRIGKAALLKNRLMRGARGPFAVVRKDARGYQGDVLCGVPQPIAVAYSSLNAATYGRLR